MGILDGIVGSLLGGGGASSPMQGVLMNLLGGNQQQQQGGYQEPGLMGGGGGGLPGGLGGLVSTLEQAGLGSAVQSWIGNGANQPVSPQQLQTAFGDDQVQSMASQSGMAPQDFLSQLSQHLPNAVNAMTPNGRLPDEGTMSV
ncbi:YidB family protein [Acidisphaera sp. L21]|uniref:YidB family protein n=1 Tax=Acidisphaera sp. L21 TaxID=1641851 RepID=UPI00131C3AFF|nr:YidB family protein [Acidisphaera sp. L21]